MAIRTKGDFWNSSARLLTAAGCLIQVTYKTGYTLYFEELKVVFVQNIVVCCQSILVLLTFYYLYSPWFPVYARSYHISAKTTSLSVKITLATKTTYLPCLPETGKKLHVQFPRNLPELATPFSILLGNPVLLGFCCCFVLFFFKQRRKISNGKKMWLLMFFYRGMYQWW